MQDVRAGQDRVIQRRRGAVRLDGLLLVFLAVGWLLIFASATLALRRNPERWLPMELAPEVSADYSVDAAGLSKLAPVRPQIVESVKQDALLSRPSVPPEGVVDATPEELPLLVFGPTRTPTLTPTPFLTPTLGPAELIVSAGGPYTGEEGNPIPLVAKGASLSPGTISYRWDLDEDGLYDDSEGEDATVVFYDEGEYVVGVEASDVAGRVVSTSTTVSVSNVAPVIYGLGDQSAGEGERVSFSATVVDPGRDDVLSYEWDFGDGEEETGTVKTGHTYRDEGEYRVRFRAEDNDGGVTEAVFVTHVSNLAPRVDAGPDQVSNEGDVVAFGGRATDPGEDDTLSYAWDLDYDGFSFTADASGPSASTVYTDGPAEVVAALRVRDEDGGQSIDTVAVTVNNVAPTIVSVVNDGPVGEGSPLTLEVDAEDAGDDTLSYAFDWENDGEFDEVGQSARVSNEWYDEGEYTVGVRVEDGDGGQVFSTTLVSAYNVAPVAVAKAPSSELEGRLVEFDGSASSDPGRDDVLSYEWDFGDGSPVVVLEAVVRHAYADNRVYSATLTVRDDSGAEGRDGVAVSILNANPVAEAGSDQEVEEGVRLSLTGTASDPGAGDELSVAWDLDYDGSHFDEDVSGTSTVEWIYGDGPARYVVAYRVRDDDYPYPVDGGGEVGETIDTLEVIVDNVPPLAEAGGPYTGQEEQPITLSGRGLDVPADVLTYEWDLDGDGHYDLSGPSVSAVWSLAGEYEVTLRVTDDDGGFGLDTAQVSIGNAPPVAEAGGPYTGYEGSPIVLSGNGTDPTDPLTYAWDLDYDGVFETPGQVVTKTWADDGVFTVTLRVDDGRSGVGTDDAIVIVENMPPTPEAGPDRVAAPGEVVTFNGTAADPGADTLTFEWDFDYDGLVFDVEATGQTVSTTFRSAVVAYTVALRVTDDDGGLGLDTAEVVVSNETPTAEPTVTPWPTPTPTRQPTLTATPTPGTSPTATAAPTLTPTFTRTPLPTATPSPTPLPTYTPTPTPSLTAIPSPGPSATNTPSPTQSATHTPMPTSTLTYTPVPPTQTP